MIDTDKYEGHTKEEWLFDGEKVFYHRNGYDVEITQPIIRGDYDDGYCEPSHEDDANASLIADAPLLLAEVKRLRKGIKAYLDLDIETSDLKELIE